jgi:Zn-dependent M28 family amino/carboxypeptidase
VGAHYDHLGQSGGQIYWGADDNGSGVAVLLDLARRLVGRGSEVRRGVLLCAFDGEEPPFFLGPGMGSVHFVQYPTVPLERIDMMICLDIIGHALGSDETPEEIRRSILCVGAERSAGTGPLLDRVAAEARGVRVRRLDSHVVPPLSDHFAFERAGIPFLFFTCGRNEHYHMPTDIPEKLDYGKLRATSEFLADLVVVLSQRPDAPVRFLPKGREDAVTLKTLNQLIVGLPQASVRFREKSRWLQRLSREVIGGRLLSRDEQVLVGGMVLELEANLGWGFAGPDGDGR